MPLNGKHAVLTGGNGGIGQELATILRGQGVKVTVIDCNPGNDAWVVNLADAEELSALCGKLNRYPPDILINLAGMMYFGHLPDQNPAHLHNMLAVNLEAPIRLSQAVIPSMLERGGGQIVNIGSVFGSLAFPHFSTYSATKAGLAGFSEALRREYAGKGIDVTHIAPRAVSTPLNTAMIEELHRRTGVANDSPEKVAAIIAEAIAHRRKRVTIGQPEGFFTRLNALLPGLIDRALLGKRDIADDILASYKR
ncbi:SDR family NAD(P)-dependent oxidoreductase [Candidatus Thiothrix sp. Deng01]|uniref:SDR family NAD(P)-dependent oxidoreductase n=1 Tax=Candidatus Thiothrix phosphatis TaxID=3112415 RepID=A0ABU6CUX4_9GAMM|nr:SDR family NAD(P)-dependent oxidoreductase [Candidatus Thiothrix sp. Deng01]MEB4590637.1 SDR family NAD(P)-dependent oxidoreductase [Candidatus Thiothrix sp. Deng01]